MNYITEIIGIYEISKDEQVYLIELEITGNASMFDFGYITQVIEGQPCSNWQSAYDEREIDSPTRNRRFVFFFHYLNLSLPIRTSFGDLKIPGVTPLPKRLSSVKYEEP